MYWATKLLDVAAPLYGALSSVLLNGLYRRIGEALDEGDRVLDVGAGTGNLYRYVRGWYICVDLGIRLLDRAKRRCDAVQADASRLPVRDGAVDHVVTVLLMHHLEPDSRDAALGEARRAARKGYISAEFTRRNIYNWWFTGLGVGANYEAYFSRRSVWRYRFDIELAIYAK